MREFPAATPPINADLGPTADPPVARVAADAADTGPTHSPGAAAKPPPGERIGKYEIVRLLGRGGMGAVYQAFDPVLEREVALKVMLPQIAEDPQQKERFEREARAVARITHANVMMVFDLGYHTDGAPYIVMELLKGQDLLHVMEEEPPLPLPRRVSIVVQVLAGLGHAHKLGIVHRDIKPANVSIAEDGTAKIMDFGIAHLASASATADGSVLGTAAYMSPEQARGERVDGRSDLFAVGSLLCELVTGQRPFTGDGIMATMYAIDKHEPQLQLPAGPEFERLRSVLQKALAKDREARFATSADFAGALTACFDGSGAISIREPAPPAPGNKNETEGPVRSSPTRPLGDLPSPPRAAARPAGEATADRPADPSKLFRLLREIYIGGKSGHLHFTAGRSCRGLRIFKGQIVHGSSDVDGEHLGDVLVRYGVILESDRQKAVETVLRERRQLGEVLMEQGLLDQERLEHAIGLHAREILFTMLDGPAGSHSFEESSDDALEARIACRLSTGEVILEATRRVLDPALVRQVLGDTGRVLALSRDPLLRAQKITLTPTDGFVMSRVDGTLTAREVLSLSPITTEDTERSLFGLLCTGVIDYAEKDTTARSRTNPAGSTGRHKVPTARTQPAADRSTPPATRPPATTPPPTPTPRASGPATKPPPSPPAPTPVPSPGSGSSAPDSGPRPAVAQDTQGLRQLILETHGRLRRDHFEVLGLERSATQVDIKRAYARFARLLHPDARRPPSLADVDDERNEVFLRVTAAYETLNDPEARRKYEIAFEPSRLRTPKPPSRPPTPPRPLAPDPDSVAGAVPPVPPSAEPEPAAAAPSAAPRSPAETEPSRFDPTVTLRDAEAQFGQKAYWDVIQKVEPLLPRLEGPLRTRGVLLLARAFMKNPKWQKRAEGVLLDLLRDVPECTPASFFLGQIYAGQELPSRARSMYRKVLELEPDHRAALAELARLEPAPSSEEEPEGAGRKGWLKGR